MEENTHDDTANINEGDKSEEVPGYADHYERSRARKDPDYARIVKDAVVNVATDKIVDIIEGPKPGEEKNVTYREVEIQTSTERIVKRVCTTAIIITWIVLKHQRKTKRR
jgi:hypothetical protein